MKKYRKNTLTIAGSDCSGGAGIQADLKSFSANGTYGMSVITAITAQNTMGVFAVENLNEEIIRGQIEAVFEDIEVHGVKIGMVSEEKIIKAIGEGLKKYRPTKIVLDPVMISKSGFSLLKPGAKDALREVLIPLAYLVTPNVPEAEELTGIKINSVEEMIEAGKKILNFGPKYVLIKGGHLDGEAIDILLGENMIREYKSERLNRNNTHGTGCTLSSAITSNLALGYGIEEAVQRGKDYITEAIRNSFPLGKGVGPVNHFYKIEEE
ncbi:bifunctional hydroxymethylpyrimidine kinase/phosphomethylpyrimidine kinase [uncultured Clostridium sp.]|uniref:bifunctional hydroxymethylpyrimidine kinase/phosphomethylpyrimidine kinase n=1 Tax=uncultured Clostridium sp. TaxID=59620 RepID=UPI002601A6BD|nr:bifunctional hydroxymethylpyrimidine kinase/phosphomethylpyrimidine kinase [uncultured Clostridium sp.]